MNQAVSLVRRRPTVREAVREESVGMAVIAYLVLIRARKQDIRPSRSWSIFQLQNNFTGDVICNQLEHSMRLRFGKLMKAA